MAAAARKTAPIQSTGPVESAVCGWSRSRSNGMAANTAISPIGMKAAKTARQLRNWRAKPNTASPLRVPTRAPMIGRAYARPRSLGGKAAARMAFELPMISAEPSPVTARQPMTCHSSCDREISPVPRVDVRMPMKKTRPWPNRSPSRAARRTKLPSTARYEITIQAVSSTPVSKYSDRVGMDRATGRLDSWTSIDAPVSASRTFRRRVVDSSGVTAPRGFKAPPAGLSGRRRKPRPLRRSPSGKFGCVAVRRSRGDGNPSPLPAVDSRLRGNDGCARVSPGGNDGWVMVSPRGNDGCARVSPGGNDGCARVSLRGNDGSAGLSLCGDDD